MGSAYDALRVYKHGYSVFFALYCIVNFFSNFGPNTTTFIVPGEAYPTHCRSTAHGISAASGKLGAVIAQVAFAWIVENTAEGNGMRNLLVVLGCVMATGVLSTCLLEETKQQSLELISHDDEFVYEDEGMAREEFSWPRGEPSPSVLMPRSNRDP
ncbi:hypothetical protein HWV62_3422 [Athelia sp. TMB]|nr:hypothetical protein HWV62_3422 [Athelia sp. TMB]